MFASIRVWLSSLVLLVPLAALPQTATQNPERSHRPVPAQTEPAKTDDQNAAPKKPEDPLFKGMQYRLIGPFRGGRSLTAAGIAGDPTTYYFGATGGGVWKSNDGAITWTPLFDEQAVSSIGSLAVAPSEPSTVYVGSGEACIRGNISHGDGVYKSLDAGKTWKNIGLRDSRAIGKLIVHPTNPNVVFVAALGHPYGPNTERGVFRSTDGGTSWQRVLYKDENTGAIDIAFAPHNPNVLLASLWEARRTPWSLTSGGPGSGLYYSNDGGSTWKQLQKHGLPDGPYGRIGVAFGASGDRMYALIEAKQGGLYRSDDGGETWTLVNDNRSFQQRAWYYMHIIADPQDPETVYILNVDFYKSTDGGRSFNKVKVPHGDNHGLWIDPTNSRRMIASNDGGVTVTYDGGKTWTSENNQPTAQFYHVAADNRYPYYLYGSQQDNSSVAIATRSDSGSIDRPDWYDVGGGEAGYIAPYLPDPNIVYAGDYEALITRFDKRTGQVKNISVHPEISDGSGAEKLEHRFQWTAPIVLSPHDPNTIYHGGERLFKTTDSGMHWEAISPNLTRNDKSKQQTSGGPINKDDTGTEYYDTIFAVAESPVAAGQIWVGTDDGLIQLTRDGGKTWNNVTPRALPEWSRISQIDASPHDAGTAYVAVDRHQNDDMRPYIFRTSDFGKSWTQLGNGIPEKSFVRAVREDPKKRGLLYAGTETGVFVSFNDGQDWRPLKLNLPTTPVHDLIVRGEDLAIATHGRSFWVLDDLSPLRQFTPDVPSQELHLYTPAVATREHNPTDEENKAILTGQNPPAGAVIYYWLKSEPKGETLLEILDSANNVIRSYSSKKTDEPDEPLDPDAKKPDSQIKSEAGLNRFIWDLRYQGATRVPGYHLFEYNEGRLGPLALPGRYQIRLTVDGKTQTAPFDLRLDPRVQVSEQDLRQQFEVLMNIRDEMSRVYEAVNQIEDVRLQLAGLKKRLPDDAAAQKVRTAADNLNNRLLAVRDTLLQMKVRANEDSLAYPQQADAKLAYLALVVGGRTDSAPTAAALAEFEKLKGMTDGFLASWSQLQKTELSAFQHEMAERNIAPVVVPASGSPSAMGEPR